MPTFFASNQFKREYRRLTPEQKLLFMKAVAQFVEDLQRGRYRPSLRLKKLQGQEHVWELSWAPNGRALFTYGAEIVPGQAHVIWLRIGGHEILE